MSDNVCLRPAHVLAIVVVSTAALFLVARSLNGMDVRSMPSWDSPAWQPAPSSPPPPPAPPRPPATTIVVTDRERGNHHTASDWPLAPRGNYAYMSRCVGPPVQVGTLSGSPGDSNQILPLYSRQSPNRSNRWQYFSRTDSNNPQDIAVFYKGKNCLAELGCEEIYDGEDVHVPAFGKDARFSVTMYPNN